MRLASVLLVVPFVAGCRRPVERTAAVAPPAPVCFAASYHEPCGASAWQIGDQLAFVRGAGSPTALARNVLIADNTFEVCGAFVGTVDDAECGPMPVFEATRFRVAEPVQRLVCDDGFGLYDECMAPDGTPARRDGAVRIGSADVESGTLACDRDGCWIDAD